MVMHHKQLPEQDSAKLYAGSIATVTSRNKDDIQHRIVPFLAHNPEQRFLFALLTESSSLAIDWKNKNFDRSIFLPGASEKNLVNINGWKVDSKLLPSAPSQN